MRAFGSEQFSTTVTIDTVANIEEVKKAIATLNTSIEEGFDAVLKREEVEKQKLALASKTREENHKALDTQIKSEMEAASQVKSSLSKAEKQVKRSNYK